MLTTYSTLLARAGRAKQAVLCCRVASLEMAQAALAAAQVCGGALALEVALHGEGSVPAPLLLDAITHLAHRSPAKVSVLACVAPLETEFQEVLESGISAVRFNWGSTHSGSRRKELTHWAVEAGRSHGVEVIGDPGSSLTPLRLRSFAESTGVPVLLLDVDPSPESLRALTPAYLHELAAGATVPLMLPELPLPLAMRRRYVQAGLRCLSIGDELEQAYAAGLRTGIRSRSVWQHARLTRPATQAVQQTVLEHLRSLTPR